jgi:hypothetical protein
MKDAIAHEIECQRGIALMRNDEPRRPRFSPAITSACAARHTSPRWRRLRGRAAFPSLRSRSITHIRRNQLVGTTLLRLRAIALRYHRQMEHELEEDLGRRDREGWVR